MVRSSNPGRGALLSTALIAFALSGCSQDTATPVERPMAGLALSSISQNAANAQTLDDLRRMTAPLHDVDAALAAGYGLFVAPPLTAPDGCISDMSLGGMGYHYTRGNNLADDSIALLDPEFLVYAPTNAPRKDGEARRRLAAFDYFLPYSAKWPGPTDAHFTRAPNLHDFSTTRDLPNASFAPSRFNGWMIHIWLWENNSDGIFANWNTGVPLCEGSTF